MKKKRYAVAIIQRCNGFAPKPSDHQFPKAEIQEILAKDPIAASCLLFIDAVSEDEARGKAMTAVERRVGDIAAAHVKEIPAAPIATDEYLELEHKYYQLWNRHERLKKQNAKRKKGT